LIGLQGYENRMISNEIIAMTINLIIYF